MSDAAAAAGQAPLMVDVKIPAMPNPPADGAPGGSPAATPQGQAQPDAAALAAAEAAKNVIADPLSLDPPTPPKVDLPDPNTVVEYDPTGNATLDLVLAYVGDRGFGPERAEVKAAMQGDFEPLAKSLAALGDKAKGYQKVIVAAKAAHSQHVDGQKKLEADNLTAVTKAVGGAAQWNAIRAFAMENADAQEKQQINAAFKAGGVAAVSMAKHLADLFEASGQSKKAPASALKPDPERPSGGDGNKALSPTEYKAEIRRITAKYGSRTQYTPEYEAANAARRRFRG